MICDTAGRMHTSKDLLQQLEKIIRVAKKINPKAPHESLLVVDALAGHSAVDQAITFNEAMPLSGYIVSKIDATPQIGTPLDLIVRTQKPVHFLGLGEGMEHLTPFDAQGYARALALGESI